MQDTEKIVPTCNRRVQFQKIAPYFAYPLLEASIKLGIEMDELRAICRDNGVPRWPYSYKRKNITDQNTLFLQFALQGGFHSVSVVPQIKKTNKTCQLNSKIEVKNLLN